jgi:GT2 family glycosyltransferase
MQPSLANYACYVTAYIGFATLLRREKFLSLGGYRELFYFYGEEKEYCLRLLDAGSYVIYLPDARVAHIPDPAGRRPQKYLRYVIRNDCLGALYNQPLPLMIAHIPARLYAYLRMKRSGNVSDPNGFRWLAGELWKSLPRVWRERRPVSWATLRRWRSLKKVRPGYSFTEEPSV